MMVVVVMMLQQHLCAQVVVDADSKDEDADDGEEDFDALPASLSRFVEKAETSRKGNEDFHGCQDY